MVREMYKEETPRHCFGAPCKKRREYICCRDCEQWSHCLVRCRENPAQCGKVEERGDDAGRKKEDT